MPLDNDTNVYSDLEEITIDKGDNYFEVYYSLDGKDPKNGSKYDNSIFISKSTTVCARNKFLFWWSDITKSSFRFIEDTNKEEIKSEDSNKEEIVSTEEPNTYNNNQILKPSMEQKSESPVEEATMSSVEPKGESGGSISQGGTGGSILTWDSDVVPVSGN